MESKAVKHLAIINKNDEYGTPLSLFLDACKKFHCKPQIDYFASESNHVCYEYFTKDDDAFSRKFDSNGFINPPYSMIGKVMQKAYEEHMTYNVELMILAYAKTDTQWWHKYVENKAEVHFVKGRIKFLDAKGKPTKLPAPYPSVWIIYRRKQLLTVPMQTMFPNFRKYRHGK